MTTVSCPKCNDQVSVPASAPRSARVRCPLCQEEYDLADALAQLPPALIIVSAGVTDEPVLAAVGAMDAATGSHIGSGIDHAFDSHLEGGSSKSFGASVLESEPVSAEMVAAPTPAFRAAPRPKRKEKSMVGELVKIVLGGVVGIGLAIVILWWGPGVDLGLAPTVNKVSWLQWMLPPKFRDAAKNQGNKEENPDGTSSLNADSGDKTSGEDSKTPKPGKLGSDPRFNEALKNSGEAKASDFSRKEKPKEELDTFDPSAVEKGSGGVGELKIESPLTTEPKGPTKKPEPAKTKPEGTSEEPNDDPFKVPEKKPEPAKPEPAKPVKPTEPTEPAEEKPAEKPAEEKPTTEKPKEEKPAEKPKEEKPAEPTETPPKEVPAAGNLAEGIDAANTAAKAFDDTDATDKEARKTAVAAFYHAYAGLGRTVEQTNLEDADNADKLPALRQSLTQAASDTVKLNSIGYFAGKKLDATDGDAGILLAGTVKDLKAAGGHFETTLELIRDKRTVTIISAKNPQDSYKIDDQVLILGSIIRDPKEKLPGYKGEATVVVKSGHAMVVPMEKAP